MAGDAGALYRIPKSSCRKIGSLPVSSRKSAQPSRARRGRASPPLALRDLSPAIGPDIAQVKRAFAASARATGHPIVLGHQGDMNRLALGAGKIVHGDAKAPNAPHLHRRHAAHLLLAERPHLSTEALLAMRAPVPVLATAFWEVRMAQASLEAMLLLWLD